MLDVLGEEAPTEWRGALDITYRLGPGFVDSNIIVDVDINNRLKVLPIYNVIGTIYGREEPDRYALIGNHRDAWVHGAVDAVSGTALITEIARGLGQLLKAGWRPRRTIKVNWSVTRDVVVQLVIDSFLVCYLIGSNCRAFSIVQFMGSCPTWNPVQY